MGNTILAVLDDIDAGLKADLATRSNAISSAIRPRGGVTCDLRIVRSLILLWSGQNAALAGGSDEVRQWIMDQLPEITERLERIEARMEHAIDDNERDAAGQIMLFAVNGNAR
ncbi:MULTISPECIES: hypothetical protein [Thalassospira]|uniref:Uncharacterized protein n=1 Tax=Thalassospira permensis NBRC 106175 TaxID=1353532 RepID=A0ABR4TSN3_9PROT|nr:MULTISPECIES: hypothetical protein [Thalassospira]KEO58858.1 hypothetical protein SMB34_12650 [Thalassospira permensis NBRC 106175]RCK40224.1 hypothetical protein TH24_09690 [Thalassospira xiamenensis]